MGVLACVGKMGLESVTLFSLSFLFLWIDERCAEEDGITTTKPLRSMEYEI